MARHSMPAADAAWLHMDRAANPMVVNALVWFDEPLDWDEALDVVEDAGQLGAEQPWEADDVLRGDSAGGGEGQLPIAELCGAPGGVKGDRALGEQIAHRLGGSCSKDLEWGALGRHQRERHLAQPPFGHARRRHQRQFVEGQGP
jgi:hypothetical protein